MFEAPARYVILHGGARRVQTVTCDVRGRSLESFVSEAKGQVGKFALPTGSYVEFTGTAEEQARSRRDLLVDSLLAMLGIVLLLSIVMGNYRNLLLVLLNLPLALVGGFFAGWLTGGNLSLGSLVGFVTLFGITVRNSIMLISHYEHLVQFRRNDLELETALRGASERLSPDFDDSPRHGLWFTPTRTRQRRPGAGNREPHGYHYSRGIGNLNCPQPPLAPNIDLRYGRFEPDA